MARFRHVHGCVDWMGLGPRSIARVPVLGRQPVTRRPCLPVGLAQEDSADSILSCTAYQLLYRRRGAQLPDVALGAAAEAWVAAGKAAGAGQGAEAAGAYAKTKAELLDRRRRRQESVREFVEAAAAVEDGEQGALLPAAWLQRLCDAGPGAVVQAEGDQGAPAVTALRCSHGNLDPSLEPTGGRAICLVHAHRRCAARARRPSAGTGRGVASREGVSTGGHGLTIPATPHATAAQRSSASLIED